MMWITLKHHLSYRCLPVYTRYQFGNYSVHQSKSFPHSDTISFNDFHVILLGTFDPSQLVEFLRGPPLLVELHDRDRRITRNSNPALFGQESKDVMIGTHAFATSQPFSSTTSKREGEVKPWDPYGITHIDLSGLLLGQRVIQLKCPVRCGPRGHSNDLETRDLSLMTCSQVSCFPPGDYIGSHCELSVVVELTYPLQLSAPSTSAPITASPLPSPQTTPTRAAKSTSTASKKSPKATSKMKKRKDKEEGEIVVSSCPFNRLVYVISAEGKSLVQQLLRRVNEINARALGFEKLPDKIRFAALSTYKLTR